MSKFGTKEELVKAIESHFSSMQHGKMSMEDLEMLVEQSRELYERVLVLRYKAYEEKIFGEAKAVLESEPVYVPQEESREEADAPQAEIQEAEAEAAFFQEEEPLFDFSLFDESATESEELQQEETAVTEVQAEESFEIQSETEFIQEPDFASEAISLEEPTISQEEVHAVEFTSPISSFDEKPAGEPEVEIEPSISEAEQTSKQEFVQEDIFSKILKVEDASFGASMMQSRLDTLVGAFGFNEKFQCIQELFKGSSDDFNQAIDVLDGLHSFAEAKEQLHYYIRLNNWDLDSEITAEFVRKVERRFK